MTPEGLRTLARHATSIATRRAAEEALAALRRVEVCLAIDAGAPTHERPAGADRERVLGPPPPSAPVAMPGLRVSR